MAWWNTLDTVQWWSSAFGVSLAVFGLITGIVGIAALIFGLRAQHFGDMKLAPRRLTEEDQRAMAAALSDIERAPLFVEVNPQTASPDDEVKNFAADVITMLDFAGWVASAEDTLNVVVINRFPRNDGIIVRVRDQSDPPAGAQELYTEFATRSFAISVESSGNPTDDGIRLVIGAKPAVS